MIFRDLQERVPKPAPFLQFDSDPYLAIVDGKLMWIYDAYTTTTEYPYSQNDRPGRRHRRLDDGGSANYMRNSVKVTVDAYTGAMTYYLVDPSDPIAVAWSKAFPEMFTPLTDASAGPAGALPLPGEPLPGAGVAVRHVPRDGPGRVLPEAGRVADPDRPHDPGEQPGAGGHRRGEPPDASLLLVDAAAERGRRALPADPAVHAARGGRTWCRGWPPTPTPGRTGS